MNYITVLAVLAVPDAVSERPNDALLATASNALEKQWPTDEGSAPVAVRFLTVDVGVSDPARAAGADPSSWPDFDTYRG